MVSTRNHPRAFPEASSSSVGSSPPKRSSSPRKRVRVARSPPDSNDSSHRQQQQSSPTKQVQVIATSNKSTKSNAADSNTANTDNSSAKQTSSTPASSSTVGRPRSPKPWTHTPTTVIVAWLALSIPLVIWDAIYILLRPHTLPGGRFHKPIWVPYVLYGAVDKLYGAAAWKGGIADGFVVASAVLNVVEVAGYVAYLYMVVVKGGGMEAVRSRASSIGASAGAGGRERSSSLRSSGRVAALAAKGAAKTTAENGWMVPVRGQMARWAVLVGFGTASVTLSKTAMYSKSEILLLHPHFVKDDCGRRRVSVTVSLTGTEQF